MYSNLPEFDNWLRELDAFELLDWERLPDIELYMDQVISYMERQVAVFRLTSEEKIVTPSMINNYIKDGVVPKTVKKKYSKEHLSILSIVCTLKQILPIQDLHRMLEFLINEGEIPQVYQEFCEMQKESLESMREELNQPTHLESQSSPQEMALLAMRLAVGANSARVASQKIIASLMLEFGDKKAELEARGKK
jgi:DNA-binding transcriptional MerR regulator